VARGVCKRESKPAPFAKNAKECGTRLDEGNMAVCVGWRYMTNSADEVTGAAMEGRRYISNCKNESEDAALKTAALQLHL
jgi:hypothetical protein